MNRIELDVEKFTGAKIENNRLCLFFEGEKDEVKLCIKKVSGYFSDITKKIHNIVDILEG